MLVNAQTTPAGKLASLDTPDKFRMHKIQSTACYLDCQKLYPVDVKIYE